MCEKNCIVCARKIPKDAKVCPDCGRYQKSIINALVFVGSIVAVITFISSAGLYITDQAGNFYRKHFVGDKIIIYQFKTNGKAAFHNSGYRNIFITKVSVKRDENPKYDIIETVYKTVSPGDTLIHAVGDQELKTNFFPFSEEIYLRKAEDKAFKKLILGAVSKNTPAFEQAKRANKKDNNINIPEFNCTGIVYYIPEGETEEKPSEMACVIVIFSTDDAFTVESWQKYKSLSK